MVRLRVSWRFMALQPILSLNRRESLPTPSAGDRMRKKVDRSGAAVRAIVIAPDRCVLRRAKGDMVNGSLTRDRYMWAPHEQSSPPKTMDDPREATQNNQGGPCGCAAHDR